MLHHVKCPRVQYRYVYNIAANICLSLCWISLFSAQHAAAAMALEKTQFKHPTPKVKNTKNGRKYFLNFLVLDSYRIKLNTNGRILVKILRIWLSRFRAFFQLLVTISVKKQKTKGWIWIRVTGTIFIRIRQINQDSDVTTFFGSLWNRIRNIASKEKIIFGTYWLMLN